MHYSEEEIKKWLLQPANVSSLLLPYDIHVEAFLASGGQGHVFSGYFQKIAAAIKIYFPGQVVERIDREVNALRQLNCNSIVKLLWYGKVSALETNIPVVVTELIKGENLSSILEKGPLSEQETGIIAYDTAYAIKNLWEEQRIVHRDIKPNNILLRQNGRACIIDLGVARHLDKSSLTATGTTWGTRGYLSPEQSNCVKQLTCKSDIYSLAIVLLECGLGHHPTNRDQQQLLGFSFYETLPDPICNWKYSTLIRKMFSTKPNVRPLPSLILEELNQYKP